MGVVSLNVSRDQWWRQVVYPRLLIKGREVCTKMPWELIPKARMSDMRSVLFNAAIGGPSADHILPVIENVNPCNIMDLRCLFV